MTMITLPIVAAEEAAPHCREYMAAVPDGRIGFHLEAQVTELEKLVAGLSEAEASSSYAEKKWTIKEVIGHLLDAERIFAYRMLRICRGDATELPGFEEKDYAPEGQFNSRALEDLVSEFKLQRASTLALVNGIPEAAWSRFGFANGYRTSARAILFTVAGHTAHHFRILRERYGLTAKS
jgi:hypothetical protein